MKNILEKCKKYDWDPNFYPSYTPKEMLHMGIFEGKYTYDFKSELPSDWRNSPKVLDKEDKPDPSLNYYEIKSRLPLSEWEQKGWINKQDPLGWFQWYCRYYLGRRSKDDARQIKRWKSFIARHGAQVRKSCPLNY